MIPRIRKTNGDLSRFGKWIVYGKGHADIVHSFSSAIRYWLWGCGVHPKIAFFEFRRIRLK